MSTPVERLAAALRRVGPLSHPDGPGSEHSAEAILAADPTLAEALELGLAWQEAEAALPEGSVWSVMMNFTHPGEVLALSTADPSSTRGTGPTPAAALRALAKRLRQRPRTAGDGGI